MKVYVSHKKVKAARITKVEEFSGRTLLTLDDENTVGHPETTKYRPSPGDYLVRYEDGYVSISPKAAFETGYTLVKE